jgi:hypothetical protein
MSERCREGHFRREKKTNTCETRWFNRTDELATFRCTFPVIVSALEYLQTNGDGKPGIHLSVLFAI